MSTYKNIKGTNVEIVSSDPSNPTDGQIWYNSATNLLKAFIVSTGTFATTANLNRVIGYFSGCGTQTSAIGAGGYYPAGSPPKGNRVEAETWNGSAWTSAPSMNNGKQNNGVSGTSNTSALAFGGEQSQGYTESFNGSWTVQPTMNRKISAAISGAGPATLVLSPNNQEDNYNYVESYNGSWSNLQGNNRARQDARTTGTTTAGLMIGGRPSSYAAKTESWNGSAWTVVNDLNNPVNDGAATGTQTAAVYFGGSGPSGPGRTAQAETWNGTVWTIVGASMNVARQGLGSSSTSPTSAILFGGNSPPYTNASESFSAGPTTITL